MTAPVKRLLFITSGPIGDCVLSTGALAWARAQLGGDPAVTIVCGPQAVDVFRAVPGLVRILAAEKLPWAGHWRALWGQLAGETFDLALDLRGSGLTYALRCARRIVGHPLGAGHQCARIGRLLGLDRPAAPILHFDARALAMADAAHAGHSFLALGPGAKFPGKRWPAERFAELALRLTAPGAALAGMPILVLGSAAEADLAQRTARGCAGTALAGELDVLASAALLARAGMFIGNDSGLMHLAAAAGAPTLGLFGPSDEARYAPFGPKALAVRGEDSFALLRAAGWSESGTNSLLQDLTIERVLMGAQALLAPGSVDGFSY